MAKKPKTPLSVEALKHDEATRKNMRREPASAMGACKMVSRQSILSTHVDAFLSTGYRRKHIRPLVVGLLDHPEHVPRPWGFFISGLARTFGARS